MRFYRVHLQSYTDSSFGFVWTTSRVLANVEVSKHKQNETVKDDYFSTIEEVEIDNSKQGILKALQHYASHPDNG